MRPTPPARLPLLSLLAAVLVVLAAGGSAPGQVLPYTLWDFNTPSLNTLPNLQPTLQPMGAASTVRLLHGGTSTFPTEGSFDTGDGADTNRVWRTNGYPAAGTGSGTAGFQVDQLNTAGRRDILMTLSIGANNVTAPNTGISRWYQPRVSTNGGATFADYGLPIELEPQGGLASAYFTNVYLNLAGFAGVNNSPDVRVQLVSVFAPGTSNYQGVIGAYNPAHNVNFDMIAFSEATRYSANPVSTTLTDAANWSRPPTEGMLASHLTFGPNAAAGGTVTVNNTQFDYNPLSITFATDVNKPHTFTGSRIVIGRFPASGEEYAAGTTIRNASAHAQTFDTSLFVGSVQTWDSGSTAGGSLTFNGQVVFGQSSGLRVAGANTTTINAALVDVSFGTNRGVTKFGSGELVLTADSGAASLNFTVSEGRLRVANTTGSATGGGSVTVNGTGRLEGTGRLSPGASRLVTVAPGGLIRGGSGASVGTLTVNGDVRVVGAAAGGGKFGVGLSGDVSAAGLVSVTGTGLLTFDVTNGPFKIVLENDGGLVLNTPYSFRIATSESGFRLANGATVTNPASYALGTEFVLESSNFVVFSGITLTRSGNDLNLQFTPIVPVPEPASVLAVAAGGLAAVGAWRSRRKGGRAAGTAAP